MADVHPVLMRRLGLVLDGMKAAGMPMKMTDGVRTAEVQNALYQIGRTKPGKIVTNADGYTVKSNHQIHSDGLGHAVDCCFLVNGKPTWDVDDKWWSAYGALAQAVGLKWGIKISSWIDRPHVELPDVA